MQDIPLATCGFYRTSNFRWRRSVLMHTAIWIPPLCVLLMSCGIAVRTVWSTEVRSPDGLWLAMGRTDETAGPGNADDTTIVSLARASDRAHPAHVLVFANQPRGTKDWVAVTLRWQAPQHLEIVLSRRTKIDTQTIKYAGIQITVRQPDESSGSDVASSDNEGSFGPWAQLEWVPGVRAT